MKKLSFVVSLLASTLGGACLYSVYKNIQLKKELDVAKEQIIKK